MKNYSPLFHTLHDEQSPVGTLGRGTHCSVFSTTQWVDLYQKPLKWPCIQKFAVVWDEDHDERVIEVIERAYMSRMFAPVLFAGEKKGVLTVVVDDRFPSIMEHDVSYEMAWSDICSDVYGDSWTFDKIRTISTATDIISADFGKVFTYLTNIDNLWSLGLNPYVHPRVKEYVALCTRQGWQSPPSNAHIRKFPEIRFFD